MNHDTYADAYIKGILDEVKTVAMVGASANNVRPSYFVLKYLLSKGYEVWPINPGQAGKEILGQKVYASLDELPAVPDMIDIFRNSEAAGAHAPSAAGQTLAVLADTRSHELGKNISSFRLGFAFIVLPSSSCIRY